MYVITYSLRENEINSNGYYRDVSLFADEVLAEMRNLTHGIVKEYMAHIRQKEMQGLSTEEEYGLELLILGTLWQIYSGDASGLDEFPRQLLAALARLRNQGGSLKPGIDFIRGIMATLFLSPDLYDNLSILNTTPEHMEKLLNWLDATGEFNQEVKRLRKWQDYLKTLPQKEASDILATAMTLAAWFNIRSEEALGKYTPNVERYLNEIRQDRYWHEDVILCGRRRVEYHLNMVGAEVMNRVFREAFINTARKMVLLPACMRRLPASKCKACASEGGLNCTGCTGDCGVNRLTKLGEKCGFEVLIVPHESSISASRGENPLIGEDTGVIGIACVLNLISGGWMLRDMDIPAQCVLLDYCGCKNHWSQEGFPTEINIDQLKRILGDW